MSDWRSDSNVCGKLAKGKNGNRSNGEMDKTGVRLGDGVNFRALPMISEPVANVVELGLPRIVRHSRGASLSIRPVAENAAIANTLTIHSLSGELSRLTRVYPVPVSCDVFLIALTCSPMW